MESSEENLNVILKPEIRHLLDDFASLLHLHTVFFSADGRELERGRDAGSSEYCHCMQQERFGLKACQDLDAAKQRQCVLEKRVISYVCHAGLGEVVAPVSILGKIAGFLVLGQFRVSSRLPACVKTERERKFYRMLPIFSEEEILNLKHMVEILLDYISEKELVRYPQDQRLLRIRQCIEKNITGKLRLSDVASQVYCSVSTLTHFLHDHCHITFSRLVREIRLGMARRLLRQNPSLSLKEIAKQCGFQSIFYFSRIFRREYGQPPGEYRRDR